MKIVCRCEDVTADEIVEAVHRGCSSLEEIKRELRCGMGACQGRTCMPLIARILANRLSKPLHKLYLPTTRPPLVPVSLGILREEKDE